MLIALALGFGGLFAPQETDSQDTVLPAEPLQVRVTTLEGHTLQGSLSPAVEGRLGLQTPDFREVLLLGSEDLATLLVVEPELDAPDTAGLFEFRLATGDLLHAQIQDVNAEDWTLAARGLGEVRVPRSQVRSIESLGGGSLVYNGPQGIAGWTIDDDHPFVAEGDLLVTGDPKATLERSVALDQPCRVAFELSWRGTPRFRVAIGHQSGQASRRKAVILEAWGNSLVAWRMVDDRLEFVELLSEGLDELQCLPLELAVGTETIEFLGRDDVVIGSISRPKKIGPRITFLNDGERLALHQLQVLAEGSSAPERMVESLVSGFDSEANALLTPLGAVPLDHVLGLHLTPAEGEAPEVAPGTYWLEYGDGRRVSGLFEQVTEQGLRVSPSWSAEAVESSTQSLTAVTVVVDRSPRRRRAASRSHLVTSSGEVAGELITIGDEGEIVWDPAVAEAHATVDRSSVERIVVNRTTAYYVSGRKFPHYLRLRNGDSFRCKLTSIGEDELRFTSPFGGEHTLEVAQVKAVEFDLRAMDRFRKIFAKEEGEESQQQNFFGRSEKARRDTSEGFDPESLGRALALPRKYKKRRPQHLILARSGDFLRTRLVSWTEEGAHYPGLSDTTRIIPNDRIAAVIWLEPTGESTLQESTARVVLDDRTRLGVSLRGTDGGELLAVSPVLGELRIDTAHLLSIELSSGALSERSPYEDWILKPMREPFPEDEQPAEGAPQVGASAPAISGKDLDGVEFELADYTGKVVMLDFWGHW